VIIVTYGEEASVCSGCATT